MPPTHRIPNDWHITCNPSHWLNETTMIQYIERILLPYVKIKSRELQLSLKHPALVIFDNFSAQTMKAIVQLLEDNQERIAMIPPNCTERLQLLDAFVNKAVKIFYNSNLKPGVLLKFASNLKEGITVL